MVVADFVYPNAEDLLGDDCGEDAGAQIKFEPKRQQIRPQIAAAPIEHSEENLAAANNASAGQR